MLDFSKIKRFCDLPKHQDLVRRVYETLLPDERIKGVFLSGHSRTDKNSDIDIGIVSSKADREVLEEEITKLAKKVSSLMCEAWAGVPHTYVCFYEEEIKVDYSFHTHPLKNRPDRRTIDILFDPTGELKRLKNESAELDWAIDLEFLENKIKHFFVGLGYTIPKLDRGELWDGKDCVDFYLKYLAMFEDILAKRKKEGFRRLEKKLSKEKLDLLNQALVRDVTREELFSCIDIILLYFDNYLRERLVELGIFPEIYAENMINYYTRRKNEVLK